MKFKIESYQAGDGGGVTLHSWQEYRGCKFDDIYIIGQAGEIVSAWFRRALELRGLEDVKTFSSSPL